MTFHIGDLAPDFTMIADPEKKLYRLHRGSFSMSRQMPLELLLDESGHIAFMHDGRDMACQCDPDEKIRRTI